MTAPALNKSSARRGWLNTVSPLYDELSWLWEQNELRFEGGHNVHPELWKFDWETAPLASRSRLRDGVTIPIRAPQILNTDLVVEGKEFSSSNAELAPGEHYRRRQDSSIYVNLMEAYATDIVGHIFRQAPAPDAGLDFGQLGIVRRIEDIDEPTRAELLYFNTDGIGSGGSQWDSFWSYQLKLAMATGYRWIYVDTPTEPARFRRRERLGFRPYFVGFSPRQVINHHYKNGNLEWAIVKLASRNPKVVEDALDGNDTVDETLLLVRAGNTDLTDRTLDFSNGGWWRFDSDGEFIQGMTGNWDKTDGEIPMCPLIYDRHDRLMGRPGLTELGNAAVALMNVQSAADFDAWDSAASVTAVRGADAKGFNLFIRKVREGNRIAPLPANEETEETPQLQDISNGQIAADTFDKRITAILKSADRIRGTESTSGPQNSGLAQQAGFTLGNVPRLSLVAGNLETTMNWAIYTASKRWGVRNPSGSVRMNKKFELIKLTSSAQAVLQLEQIAGVSSEELDARVITAAAQDEGFVPDSQAKTRIDAELRASHQQKEKLKLEEAAAKRAGPQVPGARRRAMPPEPAQTNQRVKTQMDGPNVE
jgi:hypothetical protein